MFLIAQLWVYLLCSCLLGVLIGLTARRFYRAVQIQHTLEAVEFRHTEQLAGVGAEHEAALLALEQLRHEYERVQEQGGPTHDLQTRIDLREQQLKELGSQLRRVNQELKRTQVSQQQFALERKQAAAEIETLRAQVAASRARLAQAVNAHEEEKSALVRQLVALMPSAGRPGTGGLPDASLAPLAQPAAPRDAGMAAGPSVPGTFSAAAALAGVSLAPAVVQVSQRPAEPAAPAHEAEAPQAASTASTEAITPAPADEPTAAVPTAGVQARAELEHTHEHEGVHERMDGHSHGHLNVHVPVHEPVAPLPAPAVAAMAEPAAEAQPATADAAVTIDRLLAPASGRPAAAGDEPDLQAAVQAGIAAAMSAMGQPGAGAAAPHH
jgi:hypothetical protein